MGSPEAAHGVDRAARGPDLGDMWNNPTFPFRVFKSHYDPNVLPIKKFPKVKFLAMTRNGLDVVASLVPFFSAHSDEFRKLWGGFPPASSGVAEADAAARLTELLPGGQFAMLYWDCKYRATTMHSHWC